MRVLDREPPWWFAFLLYGSVLWMAVVLIVIDGVSINWWSAIPLLSITFAMAVWGGIGAYRYVWLGVVNPKNPWTEPVLFLSALGLSFVVVWLFGGIVPG